MADDLEPKRAEIERIRAAADDLAKLMNGRFELDQAKLQAFSPNRTNQRPRQSSDGGDDSRP